jgi:hypothetical protein
VEWAGINSTSSKVSASWDIRMTAPVCSGKSDDYIRKTLYKKA